MSLEQSPYGQLQYATPNPGRPGIITGVAIASIVVGSLSVLFSFSGIVSGIMFLFLSRMNFNMPAPPPVPVVAATTAPANTGATATTFAIGTTAGPAVAPFPGFSIPMGASILAIVESSLSFCLAVLLIVAGSLIIRNSRGALRLHRIYIFFKIPLIAVGAFATWWTYTSMMKNMNVTAPGAPNFSNMMAVVQAAINAAFALIYPVTLLIVLSRRTAKEYFGGISATAVAQ